MQAGGLGCDRGVRRAAFTLLELVIVVAIIAILSAVAVPTFLEAQTRSKVARVRGDVRTVGIAVETYLSDYGTYPLDPYDWRNVTGKQHPVPWDWILLVCTTPIAYMTNLPRDPFLDIHTSWGVHTWYFTKSGYYPVRKNRKDPAAFFYGPRKRYNYCLDSPGPDRFWEFDRGGAGHDRVYAHWKYDGDVLYYDPSNGSRSQGDLYAYGPGFTYNPTPHPDRSKSEGGFGWGL